MSLNIFNLLMDGFVKSVTWFFLHLKHANRINLICDFENDVSRWVNDPDLISEAFCSDDDTRTAADYASRFVRLPLSKFASIMLDRDVDYPSKDLSERDEIEKLCREFAVNDSNPEVFSFTYSKLQSEFARHLKGIQEHAPLAYKTVYEENTHHSDMKDTSTWSFLQTLTLIQRIISIFVAYCRNNPKYKAKNLTMYNMIICELVQINTLRRTIMSQNFCIIEGFFHFREKDRESLITRYGKNVDSVYTILSDIKLILNHLSEDEFNSIENKIMKAVLNYPYAYMLKTFGYNLNLLCAALVGEPMRKLVEFGKEIIKSSEQKLRPVEIEKVIERHFPQPTAFEKDFTATIVHHIYHGLLPSRICSFIFMRVVLSKYNRNFYYMFRGFVSNIMRTAYEKMPAYKIYGPKDEILTIDSELKLFGSSSGALTAFNSIEPTLLGENGGVDIRNSEKCNSFLYQIIILDAIWFYRNPSERDLQARIEDYYKFDFSWRYILQGHKSTLLNIIIPEIYSFVFDAFSTVKNDKKELESFDCLKIVEEGNKYIFDYLGRYDLETQKAFKILCDSRYVHGF